MQLTPILTLVLLLVADTTSASPSNKPLTKPLNVRTFPYFTTLKWVYNNPGVIKPGINLSFEILDSFLFPKPPAKNRED